MFKLMNWNEYVAVAAVIGIVYLWNKQSEKRKRKALSKAFYTRMVNREYARLNQQRQELVYPQWVQEGIDEAEKQGLSIGPVANQAVIKAGIHQGILGIGDVANAALINTTMGKLEAGYYQQKGKK